MKVKRHLLNGLKFVGLLLAFLLLFSLGTALFVPTSLQAAQAQQPMEPVSAMLALLLIAFMDVAILAGVAWTSRLWGLRLWLLLSAFFYFVMTFTSQLEAWYFMNNVSAAMIPWLMAMTLPLCVGFPPILMLVLSKWRRPMDLEPLWENGSMTGVETGIKLAFISSILYPVLFFAAGYFIAWQSAEVRLFYSGSVEKLGFWEHVTQLLSRDPTVYPFEIMRGFMWALAALAVLRTSHVSAARSTLLVALAFCFIQNNLHLLSNPLMPSTVRAFHFVETGSSNFLFALCAGWLLSHVHLPAAVPKGGPPLHAAPSQA